MIVPQLDHMPFLPNTIQFIIPYHLTVESNTNSVVKKVYENKGFRVTVTLLQCLPSTE
jgi:hypothetical protein